MLEITLDVCYIIESLSTEKGFYYPSKTSFSHRYSKNAVSSSKRGQICDF